MIFKSYFVFNFTIFLQVSKISYFAYERLLQVAETAELKFGGLYMHDL